MTDTEGVPVAPRRRSDADVERPGVPARIALFYRQVIAELRKVIVPTRKELITYTSVVIVFVGVIIAIVSCLDYGFTRVVLWVFG